MQPSDPTEEAGDLFGSEDDNDNDYSNVDVILDAVGADSTAEPAVPAPASAPGECVEDRTARHAAIAMPKQVMVNGEWRPYVICEYLTVIIHAIEHDAESLNRRPSAEALKQLQSNLYCYARDLQNATELAHSSIEQAVVSTLASITTPELTGHGPLFHSEDFSAPAATTTTAPAKITKVEDKSNPDIHDIK